MQIYLHNYTFWLNLRTLLKIYGHAILNDRVLLIKTVLTETKDLSWFNVWVESIKKILLIKRLKMSRCSLFLGANDKFLGIKSNFFFYVAE